MESVKREAERTSCTRGILYKANTEKGMCAEVVGGANSSEEGKDNITLPSEGALL